MYWAAHTGSVVSWLCSVYHCHYLHCPCDQSPLDSVGLSQLSGSGSAGGCEVPRTVPLRSRGRLIAHAGSVWEE
jgi:hypothetical protein